MKNIYNILSILAILVIYQSCDKNDVSEEKIIDPFTYGINFNFREVSVKIGNEEWTAIENGNTFSLLGNKPTLGGHLKIPKGFATYDNDSNLRTDFVYTIEKDLVFSYNLSNDTIYFLDERKENREDVFGIISLEQDTTLVIHNKSLSPNLSLKYKFEN